MLDILKRFIFLKSPLFLFSIIALVLYLFPFIEFPLTDRDVSHWGEIVAQIVHTGNSHQASDQAHGPLLVSTTVWIANFFPPSFLLFNIFNAFMGLLGLITLYFAALRLMGSKLIARLGALVYVGTFVINYLSRTPMYDWPVAVCYFIFAVFYMLHMQENKKRFLIIALIAITVGSLGRFSISIVAAGIFMSTVQLFWFRKPYQLLSHLFLMMGIIIASNLPWFIGQVNIEGKGFIKDFFIDNVVRFARSNRPNDTYRFDFYGFPLYTLVALIPFTPVLLLRLFSKKWWKQMLSQPKRGWLLLGSIPLLILFSFSGHTKLLRYISYIFPFLVLAIGLILSKGFSARDLKILKRIYFTFSVLVSLIFLQQSIQFIVESIEAPLFIASFVLSIFLLLIYTYYLCLHKYHSLLKKPEHYVWPYFLIYLLFFAVVAYEATHVSFLNLVQQDFKSYIQLMQTK